MKIRSVFSITLISLLLNGCFSDDISYENGDELIIEGVKYRFNDSEFSAVGYDNELTEAIIESNINGYFVTSIEDFAFANFSSLTSITLPSTLAKVGYSAFNACSSLKNIVVDENNEYYKSIEGNLYSKDGKELLQYAVGKEEIEFIVPEGVESIKDYAFEKSISLTSVELPSTLISIGYKSFANCNLTSIIIPEGVTSIGDSTFVECISLESIELPSTLTIIGECAFYNCRTLESIIIPEGVTSIGDSTFEECVSLTNITLPSTLINIGAYAFLRCSSLTNIIIPERVTSIGDSAFFACHNLVNVILPSALENVGNYTFYECIGLTSIVINDGVTSIGDSTFGFCINLPSIVIPEGVKNIGKRAFVGCKNLTIYCEEESQPTGWSSDWNASNVSVYYAGEWEYIDGVPTPKK